MVPFIGKSDLEIIRVIHIPIFARWVEWMMRVRERHIGKKWIYTIRLLTDPVRRSGTNITGRVVFFRDRGSIGLRTSVVVWKLV